MTSDNFSILFTPWPYSQISAKKENRKVKLNFFLNFLRPAVLRISKLLLLG